MGTGSHKRRRADAPSDDASSVVPTELEATEAELKQVKKKLKKLKAKKKELEETRAFLATKEASLRPQPVAFQPDENVACAVLSKIADVPTRLALARVSKVWLKASKEAESLPASLDFSGCRSTCTSFHEHITYILGINGIPKLPEAHFMSLLRDTGASSQSYYWFLSRHHDLMEQYPEAFECYEKALAAGDDSANLFLGNCYQYGQGVEINPAKAFECYLKGDARKVPMCSNEVGDCYEKGFGVDKDMYKAVEHWCKAARGGDPEAKESLAHHGHPVSGLPV